MKSAGVIKIVLYILNTFKTPRHFVRLVCRPFFGNDYLENRVSRAEKSNLHDVSLARITKTS